MPFRRRHQSPARGSDAHPTAGTVHHTISDSGLVKLARTGAWIPTNVPTDLSRRIDDGAA